MLDWILDNLLTSIVGSFATLVAWYLKYTNCRLRECESKINKLENNMLDEDDFRRLELKIDNLTNQLHRDIIDLHSKLSESLNYNRVNQQ